MCRRQDIMDRLNRLLKKMTRMQSPRVQCCMCAASVMSALLGMFMLSAGVCLVLNYNFLDVDTSGLPPDLHNEEGKKVVGIILICVGVASLVASGLVSLLFYTACSRTPPPSAQDAAKKGEGAQGAAASSQDGAGRHGHYHSNGATPTSNGGAAGGRRSGAAAAGSLSNVRRGNDPRVRGPSGAGVAGSASRPYRPGAGKKSRHHHHHHHHGAGQGRFRNSLPSHPEEEAHSLGESRRSASSASKRLAYHDEKSGGRVNHGAQLDDDLVLASGAAVEPPVIIQVDSSYLTEEAPPSSQSPPLQQNRSESSDLMERSDVAAVSGVSGAAASFTSSSPRSTDDIGSIAENTIQEALEVDESGRTSQSATVLDSPGAPERVGESVTDEWKDIEAQFIDVPL